MRLILFDIDGTLIRSHGAGRLALQKALEELYGSAGPIEEYRMGGKIDSQIITDLLTAMGTPPNEIETRLPTIYAKMAEKGSKIFWDKQIKPCSGVEILLPKLRQHDGVVLGLLTGNSSLTAPLKLKAAGINPDQFRVCAYGSDGNNRNELPAVAYKRANLLTGSEVNGKNTVIIGDTPADILCAKSGKATAVAVASGWHSSKTLQQYQPDYLLEDLKETERVIEILLGHALY
ncbi:MAG: HAD family hydrolase [Chloroflexota bacterium]